MNTRNRTGQLIFLVLGALVLLTYYGTPMFFIAMVLLVATWFGIQRAKNILVFILSLGGVISLWIGISALLSYSSTGLQLFRESGIVYGASQLLAGFVALVSGLLLKYSPLLQEFLESRLKKKNTQNESF